MTAEVKDNIFNDIYYNEAGYGYIAVTYQDAKVKDKTITLKCV